MWARFELRFFLKQILLNSERSRFNLYKKLEIHGGNTWDPMGDPPGGPRGINITTDEGPPQGGGKDAFRIAKMLVKRAVLPTERLVKRAVLPPGCW